MSKRQRLRGWWLLLTGIGLTGVLLVNLNLIVHQFDIKADLTEGRIFSLSAGTRAILQSTNVPVTLRFYASRRGENTPLLLKEYARRVDELLRAYVEAGDGRLSLVRIDPAPFSEEEQQAVRDGIQPYKLAGGSRFYLGLAVNAAEQTIVLPTLNPADEANLEYNVTHAIYRAVNREMPTVGLMSGLSGEPWRFTDLLQRDMAVVELPMTLSAIPASIELMVLVQPVQVTSQTEYALDQFVLRGGKLIVFVDPLCKSQATVTAVDDQTPPNSSLPRLFRAWGIDYDPNRVVFDLTYGAREAGAREGGMVKPLSLEFDAGAVNPREPTVSALDNLAMEAAGCLDPRPVAGLEYVVLIHSSTHAASLDPRTMTQRLTLAELTRKINAAGTGRALPLALSLHGTFRTAFPDGPPETVAKSLHEGYRTTGDGSGRVVVVGDVDLLHEVLWYARLPMEGQRTEMVFRDNYFLLQNVLEQFHGGQNLIGIRSRSTLRRPLTALHALQDDAVDRETALIATIRRTSHELEAIQERARRGELPDMAAAARQHDALRQELVTRMQEYQALQRVNLRQANALRDQWQRLNIALVPFLIAHFGIVLALLRRRRERLQKRIQTR